jgi:hypothetical protein
LTFNLPGLTVNYKISPVKKKFEIFLRTIYERSMDKVLSIKIDPRMKKALEELAEKEFAPVTTIVKKALDKYLQEQGLDWRQEKPEKKPKK